MDSRFGYIAITSIAMAMLPAAGAQDVLTGGYDISRTNADLNEIVLTPQTVNPAQFGKLFSLPADGQIFAQPLYQKRVNISGNPHNVVFFATAYNSVYAYDADVAAPPLWSVNLGPPVPSTAYQSNEGPYTDITPEVGIIGTPVIDASTGTLYVVAATLEQGDYYYRLHALDTTSGEERFGAPVVMQAQVSGSGSDSVSGTVHFIPGQHLQRPALLLLNGVVYVAFGSHGDAPPWHGWIMGYSAANVQRQTAVFNASANGNGGSLWNAGRGLSADGQGNIYAVASNGDTNRDGDFSDSVLKLQASDLSVTDWFAPSNVQTLDTEDEDLGSSGAVLVPGTNRLVTGGKEGLVYLLNTDSLGHFRFNNAQVPQTFQVADFGLFNMALWNRSTGPVLYLHGADVPIGAWAFTGDLIDAAPASQSSAPYSVPFDGMTISANGGQPGSGILWVTTADSWPLPSTGTLHAFNADDLSSELWNSTIDSERDALGAFAKFANPTVASGKVYVPTGSGALAVYGPFSAGSAAPAITGIANAASQAGGSIAPGEIVTISGQNPGAQLVAGTWDTNGNLASELAGVQITFNGIPAPLLYTSPFTISAIVPFEIATAGQAAVEVSSGGMFSPVRTFPVADSAPGIFTLDSSGSGPAAALNQDGRLNSGANPAAPGSVIAVFATGGGQTNPPQRTGATSQTAAELT
ncbi:MAG TPA: hypothetical protein VHC72_05275, partial [Bryobacteraceae bacterium]|nr:hypothetical protein [Bryobacteraceae bacterium]